MKKNRADKDEGLFIDPLLTRPDRVDRGSRGECEKLHYGANE